MATITVLFGQDNLGAHKITHSPFSVGRDKTCDAMIDNAGVSRFHCKFIWDGKHFFVEDMESANGTYHHGHKIRKASIGSGDKIEIGKFTLIFKHGKDESPPSIKEEWSLGGQSEKAAVSDPMLTFKMDGRQMREKMQAMGASAGTGPRRASDVARAFASGGPGGPPSSVRSGVRRAPRSLAGRFLKLIMVLVVLGALGAAAVVCLKTAGVIDIDIGFGL